MILAMMTSLTTSPDPTVSNLLAGGGVAPLPAPGVSWVPAEVVLPHPLIVSILVINNSPGQARSSCCCFVLLSNIDSPFIVFFYYGLTVRLGSCKYSIKNLNNYDKVIFLLDVLVVIVVKLSNTCNIKKVVMFIESLFKHFLH